MRVQVFEVGDRGASLTKARRQAPAAADALSELLSLMKWAEHGFVVLDWTGQMASESLDTSRPVMYIQVIKSMPEYGGSVAAELPIDIDDVFGSDEIKSDDLIELVGALKESVEEKADAVRRGDIS